MSERRGWGEGSVFKKGERWVARAELGRVGGKRTRVERTAKTKREAMAKLAAAKADYDANGFIPSQTQTFAEYIEWWRTSILPSQVKESTADGYTWILSAYVLPVIGDRRLAKLDPSDVLKVLTKLETEGKSPRTRKQTRAIMASALKTALRYGYVTRNVALLTDAPSLVSPEVDRTFTTQEISRMLEASKESRIGALVEIALKLGLRQGELLALQWTDIDLDAGTLTVNATLKQSKREREGGRLYRDSPKTKRSVRTVPLSASLVSSLKAHKRRQNAERLALGELWPDAGWVFTSEAGTATDKSNLNKQWARLLREVGVEHRGMHQTRHTAVTQMALSGVPIQVASALVGHSSIAITAEVYNKVHPKRKLMLSNCWSDT